MGSSRSKVLSLINLTTSGTFAIPVSFRTVASCENNAENSGFFNAEIFSSVASPRSLKTSSGLETSNAAPDCTYLELTYLPTPALF
jgi:hypothetical protein